MIRNLFSLLVLAMVGMGSAKQATTFVPRYSVNKALAVRGGGIDPTDTAKVGAVLAGAHATLTLMSPSRTAEVYGVESTPMTDLLAQWQGIVVLGFCIQAWQMIVEGSDFKTATAVGIIPSILMQYKTLWNEDHKKLDYTLGPQLIGGIMGPLVLYACTYNGQYTDGILKAATVYTALSGVLLAFAPDKACDGYGVEATSENKASLKSLGFLVLGSSVFWVLNVFADVDPVKAFGYSWIPAFLMQISNNFITNESHAKGPSFAWMLVDAIMVAVCGFRIADGASASVAPSS